MHPGMRLILVVNLMVFALCALSAGCRKALDPGEQAAGKGKITQKLTLNVDGKNVDLSLEVMDVFLVKRGNAPEVFEIRGAGVMLVGEFPKGVRVDYGEHWDVLVGKTIALKAKGGERGDDKTAQLTLPGQSACSVVGGSFTVEKVLPEGGGQDGATPLQGKIEIKCKTDQGEKTLKGTFVVGAKTWG